MVQQNGRDCCHPPTEVVTNVSLDGNVHEVLVLNKLCIGKQLT